MYVFVFAFLTSLAFVCLPKLCWWFSLTKPTPKFIIKLSNFLVGHSASVKDCIEENPKSLM